MAASRRFTTAFSNHNACRPMIYRLLALFLCLLPVGATTKGSNQVLVGLAEGWNSSHATLTLYERSGRGWKATFGPIRSRLGKNGLAWGRGLHRNPPGARLKREGDRRSPAGVFAIGGAFGYAPQIARNPALPYRRITSRDLWVEDSSSPYYNQHLIINHDPRTQFEKDAQMKQGDHAHSLKLFVAHNAPPRAVPQGGSAIFFHIWRRNGKATTFGCTTMAERNLKALIARIDPAKRPVYVLSPKDLPQPQV